MLLQRLPVCPSVLISSSSSSSSLSSIVLRLSPTVMARRSHSNSSLGCSPSSISPSVEVSRTSSNDTSNGEHGGVDAKTPVRGRLRGVNLVLKHLGLQPGSKSNNKASFGSSRETERNQEREIKESNPFSSSGSLDKSFHTDTIQQAGTSPVSKSFLLQDDNSSLNSECMKTTTNQEREITGNKDCSSPETPNKSSHIGTVQQAQTSPVSKMSMTLSEQQYRNRGSSVRSDQLSENDSFSLDSECTRMLEEHALPTSFGKREPSRPRKSKSVLYGSERRDGSGIKYYSKKNKSRAIVEKFDICESETEEFVMREESDNDGVVFLRSPVSMEDEGEATEGDDDQLSEEPRERVLRPGMVLLKGYISHNEQISIVKTCSKLGLGEGGFYQPGYNDGAKLRLYMMCLGQDWDPQTRKYQKRRRIDKSKPPDIPNEFHALVERAMQDSHSLIRRDFNVCNAEEMLPQMSPDICIVNFYTQTGRLGLHQDRDESVESLRKGLPVVSFSVGDSAEFLYGDQRDPNKADKLILESGDVLVFGGESRHVFHGISSIIPNSAPRFLVRKTRLRPGRLNLTFRQY